MNEIQSTEAKCDDDNDEKNTRKKTPSDMQTLAKEMWRRIADAVRNRSLMKQVAPKTPPTQKQIFIPDSNEPSVPEADPSLRSKNLSQASIESLSSSSSKHNLIATTTDSAMRIVPETPPPQVYTETQTFRKRKSYKRPLFILLLGLSCFLLYDSVVDQVVGSILTLRKNGLFAANWQKLPLAPYLCLYLFELKNAKQFIKGDKPFVQEIGPYCYSEYKTKHKLVWRDDTVEYIERFRFEFMPDQSRPLEDEIEVINYPIVIVVQMAGAILKKLYMSFLSPVVFNIAVALLRASGENIIERRTAYDLLDGRKVNLVTLLESVLRPIRQIGIPIPKFGVGFYTLNQEAFGFVHMRKDSEFGPFEVYTSTKDGHYVLEITKFQGQSDLPGIESPCSAIRGNEGMLMGQNFVGNKIWIFNQHGCRSLSAVRNGTTIRGGAVLERFILNPDSFNSYLKENECFCLRGRTRQQCNGVSDMAACFGGIPMQLSFPHFLFAKERQNEVGGLTPSIEEHLGYVDLYRRLGAPLFARVAIQANVLIEPIKELSLLRNVRNVVLPVFWLRQGVQLPAFIEYGGGMAFNLVEYGSFLSLICSLIAAAISARKVYISRKNQESDFQIPK